MATKPKNQPGEETPEVTETLLSPDFPITPEVPETPVAVVLKLKNAGQGIVNWHCEEMSKDPATGKLRKMRLLQNCPTIWQDEQKEFLDVKLVEKSVRAIQFSNGRAIIEMHDQTAIDYVNNSAHNLNNPLHLKGKKSYFTVWNPIQEAMEDDKREHEFITALQYAATTPMDIMKRHAVYLGIRLANDLGMTKTEVELRRDYMKRAKQDPAQFLRGVNNPAVEYNYAVKVLVTNGEIDPYTKTNQAYWKDGGFICSIPDGKDAIAYLTQFATENEAAARDFAAKLKQLAKL